MIKIPNPTGLINLGRVFVAANRPEILFGASVVSTVSGVILAAKGGWDARGIVDSENTERYNEGKPLLTKKEIAKLTWINYLPAAGLTGAALGSTTGLHLVHIKEKKQLATAALMAVDQVKREAEIYRKEITESLGLSHSEDPKELDKAAKKSGIARIVHADGDIEEIYLVRDMKTGRDFWSNKARIEEAMMEVNKRLQLEDTELNCFYTMAQEEGIPEGEDFGWNAGDYVGLEWDTGFRADGRPFRSFRFSPEPSTPRRK